MKCCVYTRSFAERPYMDFFIEHYIHLGFDKIVVLKSDKMEYKCPNEYTQYVTMYQVPNLGDTIIERYDHLVLKSEYDWILCVDIDEFLLLNKKFKNIKNYIEEKTKLTIEFLRIKSKEHAMLKKEVEKILNSKKKNNN